MVVLALDTTARRCSAAVLVDGDARGTRTGDPSRSAAAYVPALLQDALAGAALDLGAVDVFAVAVGPGSFTGLRVGIAGMQGLAFARRRPLVGVSAFDALACQPASAGRPRWTATWIDAWRGEIYAALYEDGALVEPPTVEPALAVVERLALRPTRFLGDGVPALADAVRARFGALAVVPPDPAPDLAVAVARLAAERVRAGHRPGPHAIQPLYVRRPDAERARAGT